MDINKKTTLLWVGVVVMVVTGIALLVFSFGGSAETDPVVDVNAVYTNAAATIAAQQQTLSAGVTLQPVASAAPLPISSPTFAPTPLLLPTVAAVPTTVNCDVAVYVRDVTIPDGTVIPAGQSFTKTWQVANKGTCAWTATYQLVFVGGDSLGGKSTPLGKIVNPGESAEISVVLTASSASGKITGTWQMVNDQGKFFGDGLTVVINSGTGVISTLTLTPDPSEITPTEEPIATEIPTEEPATEAPIVEEIATP